MKSYSPPAVSVVGLGKLGLPMASYFASHGVPTIGYDKSSSLMESLQSGVCPHKEAGLQELLKKDLPLQWGGSIGSVVTTSQITFVVVPTPSFPSGDFSTEYVEEAFCEIGKALHKKTAYHLIVLASTVTPGSFNSKLRSVLERSSQKRCGIDFGYVYNPQFIALGSVLENLEKPDLVLIGESDSDSGGILQEFYRALVPSHSHLCRTSVINAEIAKLSINAFVTTKISFSNFIGRLCEKFPGANTDAVTQVMGWDRRIGHAYLKSGNGFGGPCFPRDNQALLFSAASASVEAFLPRATLLENDVLNESLYLLARSQKRTPSDRFGIFGLSYKPGTAIFESSTGAYLQQCFIREEENVSAWEDPQKMNEHLSEIDILILVHPLKELRLAESSVHTVIDCWRSLDPKPLPPNVHYIGRGIG